MDKYAALKKRLSQNSEWPTVYMFKFIVPAQLDSIAQVEALFDENAIVYRKESKTGKFVSITAKQKMGNVQQIINVYQKAESIKNIVAL